MLRVLTGFREKFTSLPPERRRMWIVTFVLVILSAGFFRFVHEWPEPWDPKAEASLRIAQALKVTREEVPRSVYFQVEKLGELQLNTRSYRQIGLWYAGILCGSLLALAAATAWWWMPRTERGKDSAAEISRPATSGKRGLLFLAAIVALAAAIRAPHLDRAIYFDEQDNLRRSFHGYLEIRPDGGELWRPAGWSEALWENRLGNNPVFCSVATQASLTVWRSFSGADRQQFNIVAMRMPVFLAGLASIWALWWLLNLIGLPRAGLLAALLASVHPMHIDYSLQARGYAFVLFFAPLALGFGWRAWQSGRWRDWFKMTFSVFFCIWSYTGAFYFALTLNAGLLFALLWLRFLKKEKDAGPQIFRMLAANGVVAVIYLFLMTPHIPQISYHFRNIFELIGLRPYWLFYAWSHYSTGTDFPLAADIGELRDPESSVTLAEVLLQNFALSEPILAFLQWVFIPGVILAGIVLLWRHPGRKSNRIAAGLMSLSLAAPVIALIHQQFTSLYFYYWYLTYSLPAVIAAFAIGFELLIRRLPGSQKRISVFWSATAGIFMAVFIWQTWHFSSSRPGRIVQSRDWPVIEGVEKVEFRRGRSLWVTTRDGQEICERNVFEKDGGARAGRDEEDGGGN